ELDLFPFCGMRRAILHFFEPARMRMELVNCRPFWTQTSARDRRIGISFDRNQLSIFVIYQLPASDTTIGTAGRGNLRAIVPRPQVPRAFGVRLRSSSVRASSNLLN